MATSPPYGSLMDCTDLREALIERRPIAGELVAHVEACEACAQLMSDDARLAHLLVDGAAAQVVPTTLSEALRRRMADEPTPGDSRRRALTWWVGVGIMAAWASVRHRPNWTDVNLVPAIGLLAALGLSGLTMWWVARRPPFKPPAMPAHVGLAVVGGLVACALPGCVPLIDEGAMAGWSSATAVCFGVGTAITWAMAGLWWALERRTVVGERLPLAVLLGAIVANAALVVHCPHADPGHVWVGHTSLGVLWAGLAWALGRASR